MHELSPTSPKLLSIWLVGLTNKVISLEIYQARRKKSEEVP